LLNPERALPGPEDDDLISMTDLAGLLVSKPESGNKGDASPEGTEEQTPSPTDEGTRDNSDEGIEAAEPAEGEGDGQTEGEGDGELSTEPLYTVKINGKDEQVNLKEALAGYQRTADYTRKTEEVANARRVVEAEQAQARHARDQYSQVLGVILQRLGPENGEMTAEQWNALRQSDPGQYVTEWADFQRRENQRNAVKEEQARIINEQRFEVIQRLRSHLDGERFKLVKALPVLAHPEKGPPEMKAMREYASSTYGFSEAEMDQSYDHRLLLMLDKARKWDNHQATLAKARGKIESAQQVTAPGARQPPKTTKSLARKAAQEKFNRSGDIEDAIPLLLNN
jgi:hypothetical protein